METRDVAYDLDKINYFSNMSDGGMRGRSIFVILFTGNEGERGELNPLVCCTFNDDSGSYWCAKEDSSIDC